MESPVDVREVKSSRNRQAWVVPCSKRVSELGDSTIWLKTYSRE
jgi:hypothetical protein